jgi:hypothetical protein
MLAAAAVALALAAPCSTHGAAPFIAPDNACTPGDFVRKTKTDVCDGQTVRPSLPTAEERAILRNYGLATFTGRDGEKDHRVPLVLGGTTDRRNIWPEPWGPGEFAHRENAKDKLEDAILRRVCKGLPHPMRVTTAVRVFLADWLPAFEYYVLGVGPRPIT